MRTESSGLCSSSLLKSSEKRGRETMTECSNRSNRNGTSSSSPITNLTQDQLYSILLLLPTDSILSFSGTCKRFRSLSYSSSLWESVCRRDWGHSSVDAIKSSSSISVEDDNQLPWKKIYQRVYQFDQVSCSKLSNPQIDELQHPRPRASHSLNFLSGCLVLFGGGSEGGRHLDDTWIANIGNDSRKILRWQMVTSGNPSGRFGHSCVVIGDSLVLFGGINDHGIRQNDTWIGQITLNGTTTTAGDGGSNNGITLSWRLLDVGPILPPARGAHAGCSTDNRRMLIHGGIGLSGTRLGDTWVLDLSEENLCYGSWHEIVSGNHPSPAARSGHTLTNLSGTQTVVLFGGRGLGYEVLHDVWLYKEEEDVKEEGHLRWVQLRFELQSIPRGLSLPRVGHSATVILGGQLLIHGGEDTYRHRKNDFWVLDINSSITSSSSSVRRMTHHPSSEQRTGALSAASSSSSSSSSSNRMWRRLKSEGYNPNSRSFHRSCTDLSGRYLYVFGGMVDGLLEPSEAIGLRFDGELFLVELVL